MKKLNQRGFSLVEVTMALGIISFGMVSVLGLIPVGLNTMRQAMDATVEEQIVRKISGEVLLTPYSQISSKIISQPFYFDDQGTALKTSGKARFRATVADGTTAYPGSTATPPDKPITDSMRMLRVQVDVTPNGGGASISVSNFRILVSNSGT